MSKGVAGRAIEGRSGVEGSGDRLACALKDSTQAFIVNGRSGGFGRARCCGNQVKAQFATGKGARAS